MTRKRKKGFKARDSYRYGPGISSGPKPKVKTYKPPEPPRQSGGTSGDLTIEGYQPKTPTIVTPSSVSAGPSRKQSSVASIREPAKAAARAAVRQERLVTNYVTKSYEKKLERKGVPDIGRRVQEAKEKLSADRDRLLNHPAIQEANAEGKVVPPKGLQKIKRREDQAGALSLPGGLKTTKKYGVQALGLSQTPAQRRKLELSIGNPQGTVGKGMARAEQKLTKKTSPQISRCCPSLR